MRTKKIQIYGIGLQSLYWMTFCSIFSYAVMFLETKGFSSVYSGALMASASMVAAVIQPLMGSWADKGNPKRLRALIFSTLLIAILSNLLIQLRGDLNIVILFSYVLSLVSIVSLQPLMSAIMFNASSDESTINFGVARAFGSLAFAGASSSIGYFIALSSVDILPKISLGMLVALTLIVYTFPVKSVDQKDDYSFDEHLERKSPFLKRYPRFKFLLTGIMFIFVLHSMLNVFMIYIVKSVGGSEKDFGLALMMMAAVEIPAMVYSSRLIRRFSIEKLFAVSIFFYIIRGTLFVMATSMTGIYIAQLTQAVSFALYIPVSVAYINLKIHTNDRVKGQTLIVSATTLGNVAGSMVGGTLIDNFGVTAMLISGLISVIIGFVFVMLGLKK
ncbi:MAG: MFS transporter [Clostridiales bacterium]|nr:MFS transporter [Clostridiales bacterium]